MQWFVLCASFALSSALAVGVAQGVLSLGRKDELNLMLPLLPFCNALVFPFLERIFPSEEQRLARRIQGRAASGWTGALDPILVGFLVGMLANAALDLFCGQALQRFQPSQSAGLSSASFLDLLIGRANPFIGRWRLAYLMVELVVVSAIAGFLAGLLSEMEAMLNGILTGAFLALWMAANQFASVYEALSNGLLGVLFVQVLLCAVFSGWAFRLKSGAAKTKLPATSPALRPAS